MKFKKIPNEYFFTILDRLTRFEPAFVRYKRVFDDIISKFCLEPVSKDDLNTIEKINLVEEIFGYTLNSSCNDSINNLLLQIEDKYFIKNIDSNLYLNSKINYKEMCKIVSCYSNLPVNSVFFNELVNFKNLSEIYKIRAEKSLLFPIEKIILCEGQTEYLLLKTIFKVLGIDFDKLGIMTIQAGGKSKVVKKYYELIEYTKLPFFILMDKDGKELENLILPKLRPNDKLYIISCGEFEDLIPIHLLHDGVNYIHNNELPCVKEDFKYSNSMVKNLEEIYRKYGFGDFKKAHFALEINEYIKKFATKSDFSDSEIVNIASILQEN